MRTLVSLISFLGIFANADVIPYYDPNAVRLCNQSSNPAERERCFARIKDQQYDRSVIDLCSSTANPFEQRECLGIIQNKLFLSPEEIRSCSRIVFSFERRSCLANASSAPIDSLVNLTAVSLNELDQAIGAAISAVQGNNSGSAENVLKDLRTRIEKLLMNLKRLENK